MPKEEWGVKRLCPKCATRFYDLNSDPMTCPACGEEFDLASLLDNGSKGPNSKAKPKEDVAEAEVVLDDDDVILDDDDSVDDDLLDDDDDDDVNLDDIADVAVDDEDN